MSIAISLLEALSELQDKTPGRSIKRKQMRAAFDLNYLAHLLKI